MGESSEHLLKLIRHYQEYLDKYTVPRNDNKLLYSMGKLYKLPIKVSHLEETGVGRTVNALRKLGGDVGDVAKSLVSKWKDMVAKEESKAEEENEKEGTSEDSHKYSSEENENLEKTNSSSSSHKELDRSAGSSSSHHKHKKSKYSSKESSKRKSGSNNYDTDLSNSKNKHKKSSSHRKSEKRTRDSESSDTENQHNNKLSSDSSDSEEEIKEKSSSKRKYNDSSESEDQPNINSKLEYSDYGSQSEADESPKPKKSKVDYSSSKHHRNEDETIKKNHKENSEVSSKSKIRDDSKSSSKKHKKHSKDEKSDDKHKKQESSRKDRTSHSSKDRTKSEEKSSSSSSSSKSRSEKKASSSSSKHKDEKSASKDKKSDDYRHKQSSKSSSSSKSEKMKSPKKSVVTNHIESIDSGSGASFAEALGWCAPPISKSSSPSVSKKKSSPNSSNTDNNKASTSSEKPAKNSKSKDDSALKLLKEPSLEPLDINLTNLLPTITPNYRPLGNVSFDVQQKRALTDYEALTKVISSKNQRTKVYSGNKTGFGTIPTLFEICTRILQDHIDALEYTGGVPYSILKPILEKANPDQLYILEHHNPYLIEETDELWQLHCQREFRNKRQEELESWRDMYLRCLDEREAKLKALTANIKQSQDKSLPVRTTKLAYVDDVVKPPRNIARKQIKNGTVVERKPSTSFKLSSLATAGEAGKVAVPNPGSRAMEQRSNANQAAAVVLKQKKAPLMAKSLSLFKNRFRR